MNKNKTTAFLGLMVASVGITMAIISYDRSRIKQQPVVSSDSVLFEMRFRTSKTYTITDSASVKANDCVKTRGVFQMTPNKIYIRFGKTGYGGSKAYNKTLTFTVLGLESPTVLVAKSDDDLTIYKFVHYPANPGGSETIITCVSQRIILNISTSTKCPELPISNSPDGVKRTTIQETRLAHSLISWMAYTSPRAHQRYTLTRLGNLY